MEWIKKALHEQARQQIRKGNGERTLEKGMRLHLRESKIST